MEPHAHHELSREVVPQMTLRALLPYGLALDTHCVCRRSVGCWLRLLAGKSPSTLDWPILRVARGLRCSRCGRRPRRVVLLDLNEHAPTTAPADAWAVILVGDDATGTHRP